MIPTHHLPADWLPAYAAGTLTEAHSVIAATHLVLCPVCRAHALTAERAASLALIDAPPQELDPAGLDAVCARLDEPDRAETSPSGSSLFPLPLVERIGPPDAVRWRWLAPFVRGVDVPVPTEGLPLRVVRMRAGTRLAHRHAGEEVAVVLQGGWTDATGHYVRGDLAWYPGDMALHDQRVDAGPPCVALVLNRERAVFTHPWASRIARRFFRI